METVDLDGTGTEEIFAGLRERYAEAMKVNDIQEGEFTTEDYAKSEGISISRAQSKLLEMAVMDPPLVERRWLRCRSGRRRAYRVVEETGNGEGEG